MQTVNGIVFENSVRIHFITANVHRHYNIRILQLHNWHRLNDDGIGIPDCVRNVSIGYSVFIVVTMVFLSFRTFTSEYSSIITIRGVYITVVKS